MQHDPVNAVPEQSSLAWEHSLRINSLIEDNQSLKKHINQLQKQLAEPAAVVEKIIEVEKAVPVEVERAATGDLREAARLFSVSEFNRDKIAEKDIYNMLLKLAKEDVQKRLGFWAVPLPKTQHDPSDQSIVDNKYIGKK